jgi:hypothetical protein
MANRAYLYSKNREEIEGWEIPEENYYDSRWDIPMTWFFFFCERDLWLIENQYSGEGFESLKLVAEKKSAISLLQSRRVILDKIVKNYLPISPIDDFLEIVSKWPGNYLILDADEIFPELGITDQEHKIKLAEIFTYLDSPCVVLSNVIEFLQFYSYISSENKDGYLANIIGVTYI